MYATIEVEFPSTAWRLRCDIICTAASRIPPWHVNHLDFVVGAIWMNTLSIQRRPLSQRRTIERADVWRGALAECTLLNYFR